MPRHKKSTGKSVKQSAHGSDTVSQRKFFAFSVLLAGLAALYYWYHYFSGALPPQETRLFTVVDIPGKGKGVIAERDIKRGELVLKEKPLFVVPNVTSATSSLVYSLLQGLSTEGQQLYLNLTYYLPEKEKISSEDLPKEIAFAISETNGVALGNDIGIFPHMARLNHACAAAFNVLYQWREEEKCLVVHALKNIRKGQELTTPYLDTKQPRDERRAYLSQIYGFHCSCDVCSLPDELSKASDERLSEIARLYEEFSNWESDKIDGAQAVDNIRKIWKLSEEEGYLSERGQLAADAAWIAAAHSDGAAVREWADLARTWFSYEIGADDIEIKDLERIVAHPELHASWGTRADLHVGGKLEVL